MQTDPKYEPGIYHTQKSRIFEMVFSDKRELLGLYNAVNGTRIVKLPTPKFLVFYNGITNLPDVVDLNLSDAFQIKETNYSLELKATLLNINPGHNEKLLHACKTLGDYSRYTDMVYLCKDNGSKGCRGKSD